LAKDKHTRNDKFQRRTAGQRRRIAALLNALQEVVRECGEQAPASNYTPQNIGVTTMDHWSDFSYRRGIGDGNTDRTRQQALKRALAISGGTSGLPPHDRRYPRPTADGKLMDSVAKSVVSPDHRGA
jgi:hypothetical protein